MTIISNAMDTRAVPLSYPQLMVTTQGIIVLMYREDGAGVVVGCTEGNSRCGWDVGQQINSPTLLRVFHGSVILSNE